MQVKPFILSILFVVTGALAEEISFPVERPTLAVGDSWKYQETDLWTKNLNPKTQDLAITVIEDNRIYFVGTFANGKPLRYSSDLDLNVVYKVEGVEVTNKRFQWPMTTNVSWKNDRKDVDGDVVITHRENCNVSGTEKLNVPAGEFETVRYTCKGFFDNTLRGQGSYERIFWYAPAVKSNAKWQEKYWYASRLNTQRMYELKEYKVAGSPIPEPASATPNTTPNSTPNVPAITK